MMKTLLLLCALLYLSNCLNYKCYIEERQIKECPDSYNPVCGIAVSKDSHFSQNKRTFHNKCFACKEEIDFVAEGRCDEYPKIATFCHPDTHNMKGCSKEYFPVCGMFESQTKCVRSPCGQNYSNKCHACHNGKVTHFIPNHCEEEMQEHHIGL